MHTVSGQLMNAFVHESIHESFVLTVDGRILLLDITAQSMGIFFNVFIHFIVSHKRNIEKHHYIHLQTDDTSKGSSWNRKNNQTSKTATSNKDIQCERKIIPKWTKDSAISQLQSQKSQSEKALKCLADHWVLSLFQPTQSASYTNIANEESETRD